MKTVAIESPLAGDFERNVRYARFCMLDCLQRGEAPYASHLLYTQVWDDDDQKLRHAGMTAGILFANQCNLRVFYIDLGTSHGMYRGMEAAEQISQRVEERKLPVALWEAFQRGEEAGCPTKGAV